jgi:hypothetical protein
MAKKKTCSSCKEQKLTTQFSKYKSAKDGLQPHCKECQSTRTRPITNKLLKADKDGVIYTITNPIGEVYSGQTNTEFKYRWSNHKSAYKTKYGKFPLLHQSFDTWGIDAHIFKVIQNHGNIDKVSLKEIESNMIKAYKLNGKSLNVNN